MEEKIKIEQLMREFNMNSAQFAEEVGIKNSTLSHILNDRNKASLDVLKKILGRFQQINPEWLIMDLGKMYRPIINSQEPTLFDDFDLTSTISDNKGLKNIENIVSDFSESVQKKESTAKKVEIELPVQENVQKIVEQVFVPKIEYIHKNISRIIIYYNDNTFEEFDSKKTS